MTVERWRAAQHYERSYWVMRARQIAAGASSQLGWYRWRADQLATKLQKAGLGQLTQGSARVIEIGSGPVGIAGFFPAAEMALVDPLEEYYATDPVLTAVRNPQATYQCGMGEELPAESSHFDLAIIDNCIDHVRDVNAVMQEIRRVLRAGGVVYLTVNSRTRWGFPVHRVFSLLRLDAGHPHTFTPARVRRLILHHGLELEGLEAESYREAKHQDLTSHDRTTVAKAIFGMSEFLVTAIARRPESEYPPVPPLPKE